MHAESSCPQLAGRGNVVACLLAPLEPGERRTEIMPMQAATSATPYTSGTVYVRVSFDDFDTPGAETTYPITYAP